ncbi:MAG: component of the polarisome [Candelina mexicana]|nr:MAG: component of the polarisome [Candelina mexicana]
MNGPQNTLSPVSADGSEWSAVARYQSFNNPDSPFSPVIPSSRGGAPITPPISGSSTMMTNGGQIGVGHGPNDSPSNPSPPSSIARSSVGTGLSSEGGQSRRAAMLEEKLSEHYVVLRRYLAPSLRDEKGNTRPNRARDKLLRLSAVQFQELSTDVFDELLRRQSAAAIANGNGSEKPPHATPPDYLLPKDSFHPKRNQARQKLSTLPPPRFRDLATDVFYELERRFPRFVGGDIDRVGSPASLRGPPSRNGTPVLGARPGSRGAGFRGPGHSSINSNSSYTRNGPPGGPSNMGLHVPGGSPQNEYGRPLPKTFQSNTVIPNKSTLVEDDDDQTGPDDDDDDEDAFGLEGAAGKRQSKRNTNRSFVTEVNSKDKKIISDQQTQINQLEDKIDTLEGRVREQDEELGRLQDSKESDLSAANRQREQWSAFKSDLANKLTKAEDLNNSLLSELERLRTEGSANERDLRLQLDQVSKAGSSGDSQWKGRHDSLQAQFESIKIELNEQQQVTEEVKRDAAESLQEMKVLSERSHQCWEREEKLVRQVSELEKEIQEWKGRYARTRTQLRMFHASSMGSALQQQDAGQYVKDHAYTRTDGLVKDVHVTKYQMSIDDLLRVARSSEPSAVNELMKSVVLSVRRITQDIDDAALSDKNADQIRNKLKARISATANNLITAARNFATSNGLSPVSLLDAAASHLSAAVVDLVRVVKIRPTQNTEDESDGRITPGESPINFPEEYQRATSSIYSAATSPRDSDLAAQPIGNHPWIARQPPSRSGYTSKQGPGQAPDQKFEYNSKSQDEAIEGLKIYLEDQTEGLVRSIQYLVASIRADEENSTIVKHIDSIAGIVGDVVTSTETAFEQTGNKDLRRQVGPVIHALANCRIKLTNAGAESRGISDRIAMKEFTNKIPPIAFEIARETKELCQTVDHVGLE